MNTSILQNTGKCPASDDCTMSFWKIRTSLYVYTRRFYVLSYIECRSTEKGVFMFENIFESSDRSELGSSAINSNALQSGAFVFLKQLLHLTRDLIHAYNIVYKYTPANYRNSNGNSSNRVPKNRSDSRRTHLFGNTIKYRFR